MNLFEQAIEKDELLKFALGKDEYFVADRDYGDHSVIVSWTNYILPLIEIRGLDFVNGKIEKMILELLDGDLEDGVKNESLLYHLHVYYYLASEGRIKAGELTLLNQRILNSLDKYVELLRDSGNPKESAVINGINLIRSRGGLIIE